jgi:hypothetical protein
MEHVIQFLPLIPNARAPQCPDPTLNGSMPLRAYRYCEPFILASSFGWMFFSPIEFRIIWTGNEFLWRPKSSAAWIPLGTAQMPGYSKWFEENAPENYRRLEIPFLAAFPERGVVQVWTGFAARTKADWSLLIRGVPNISGSGAYCHLEGIVEHDWWTGPVMANLQFVQSNQEVVFSRSTPLLLAQPVHRQTYTKAFLESTSALTDISAMSDENWRALEQAVFFGKDEKPIGSYAKESRKRSKRFVHQGMGEES